MFTIALYRSGEGEIPFLDWFDRLSESERVQCRAKLVLLAARGHLLRRPTADFLRDGIYELRVRSGRVRLRLLYFFHGRSVIILSHGFGKREARVPPIEIERALSRKRAFEKNPDLHIHVGWA